MSTNWDEEFEALLNSKILYLNDDYWEFLVTRVWRLERAMDIVDFGCGYGYMGQKLLPLLPDGCTYTGVDQAPTLLGKGREIFGQLPFDAKFIQADAHSVPLADNSFDLGVSRASIMHMTDQQQVVDEMVRVTRDGGMIVVCEGNPLAHMAAYYSSGPVQPSYDLGVMQRCYAATEKQNGRMTNIGFKLPTMLRQAGVVDVQCRLSDCVPCYLPGDSDDEHRARVYEAISGEGYGVPLDELESVISRYVEYGIEREVAEQYVRHLRRQISDFIENGPTYDIVYPGMISFSFGTVRKS